MRFLFVIFLAIGLVGCAKNKSAVAPDKKNIPVAVVPKNAVPTAASNKNPAPLKDESKPVITPSRENVGHVSKVNESARFVVLTFPEGNVPSLERKLSLYRNGLKVAEIKVTGPQRDNNTVADIVAGDAQVNDEARGN